MIYQNTIVKLIAFFIPSKNVRQSFIKSHTRKTKFAKLRSDLNELFKHNLILKTQISQLSKHVEQIVDEDYKRLHDENTRLHDENKQLLNDNDRHAYHQKMNHFLPQLIQHIIPHRIQKHKYRLFIVQSQFQLLEVVNLIANTPKLQNHKNDILVDLAVDTLMPKNYLDTLHEVFENVYVTNLLKNLTSCELNEKINDYIEKIYPEGCYRRLLTYLVNKYVSLHNNFAFKIYLGQQFCASKYYEIYLYSLKPLVKLLFAHFYYHCHIRVLHLLDDGLGSYYIRSVENYFTSRYKDLNVVQLLFAPNLIQYTSKCKLEAIPKISYKNTKVLQYINRLFGYSPDDNLLNHGIDFVIIDQSLEWIYKAKNKQEAFFDFKVELYQMANKLFNGKIWLKPHYIYLLSNIYHVRKYNLQDMHISTNQNNCPFEVQMLNCKKPPVQLTICSTAVLDQYYAIELDQPIPKIIVLDRLFQLQRTMLKCHLVIDKLHKKYNFYRPSTKEEYLQILQTLANTPTNIKN